MIGIITYIFLIVAVVFVMFIGISFLTKATDVARLECEVVSGHFLNNRGYECWSLDGTRRLFPSNKF